MTTESARGKSRFDLAHGAPAVLLIAGAALELFAPTVGIAPPMVVLAVALTLRFPRHGFTLAIAAAGTAVLLYPTLFRLAFEQQSPGDRVLPMVAWIAVI